MDKEDISQNNENAENGDKNTDVIQKPQASGQPENEPDRPDLAYKNAKDVAREYAQNKGADGRGKRALILFYGKDIEGFDKKNNLHRELQSNHFIYIAYNHGREMKLAKKYPGDEKAQDSLIYEWSSAKNVH